MFKVLKFAKKLWYVMIFILLLLVVQVFCELTLPDYTSDIVDVGIQNKGVEYPIPEEMSEETYHNLGMFLTDVQKNTVDQYYKHEKEEYVADLNSLKEDERTNLEDSMLDAEMVVYLFTADSAEAKQMQGQMLKAMGMDAQNVDIMSVLETMPEEQRQSMTEGIKDKLKDYPDYMSEAMGVQFATAEYEKLGIDMDRII